MKRNFRHSRRVVPGEVLALALGCIVAGWALLLLTLTGRPVGAHPSLPPPPAGNSYSAEMTVSDPEVGGKSAGVGPDSHRLVATIPLAPGIGQRPAVIAADPRSPRVYVGNEGSYDITVLSGTAVLGMVAAVHEGESPYAAMHLAVHPTNGHLYAVEGMSDRNEPMKGFLTMQIISGTQVLTTLPLDECPTEDCQNRAMAMAFQPATGFLYLLAWYWPAPALPIDGRIMAFDGSSKIMDLHLPNVIPWSVAADPQTGYIYVTADLTDSVYILERLSLIGTATVPGARQVVVQPATGLAYVQSEGGYLTILRGSGHVRRMRVGEVAGMAAAPQGGYLYISHPSTPTVTIISGTQVLTKVGVSSPGGTFEVNPATGLVYLRHPDAPVATVFSGTAVLAQVKLAGDAAIEANPVTGLVYAVEGEDRVAVLERTQRLLYLPPAAPQPRDMERNPRTGQIVVLSSPPALSLVQGETIIASTPLTATPGGLLVHPASGLIYLTLPDEKAVLVMSGTVPLATIPVLGAPRDIAVQPRTGLVYVAGMTGTLSIISGTVRAATVPVAYQNLDHLAADPESGLIYVTDPWSDTVHVLSGTEVITGITIPNGPHEVAVVPRRGYAYVSSGYPGLHIISATEVITSISLNGRIALDMEAAPVSGLLYLRLCYCRPLYTQESVGVFQWNRRIGEWTFPSPDETRLSCLESHPSRNYLYAGHAVSGGRLSIGMGPLLLQTMAVGDGSWVRAVAVDPATDRVYVATDHAIAILKLEDPFHTYLPWIGKGGSD